MSSRTEPSRGGSPRRQAPHDGPWRWTRALVEALVLALVVALLFGLALGCLRTGALLGSGFVFPAVEAANRLVARGLLFAAVFFVLFLPLFALLHRRRGTLVASFVGTAVGGAPLFAAWGRRLDLDHGIGRANFFDGASLAFNLKLALGFVALWVGASLLLWLWVRWRVLTSAATRLGWALLLVLLAVGLNLAPHVVPRPPHVILLVIDCLRADHLSCYGYERPTSPSLDLLAQDSVRFENAISQSTYTKTSVASLFTSKNPHRHGVYHGSNRDADGMVSDVLGPEHATLAEVLSAGGFLTGAWLDQGQLRAYMGFSQGFHFFHNRKGSIDRIHERFTTWRERLGAGTPFFAYLHYLDLHDPYSPQGPYATMYGVYSDFYQRVDFDLMSWGRFHGEIRAGERTVTPEDVDQLIAYYDGLITAMDASIGELLDGLKRAGVYDDALIVVTSDHGDGFMEHGFLAHSAAPYEELVRVPLLVKLPDSRHAGRVVEEQVRLIDVMPTVLDVLDLPLLDEMEGVSLRGLLEGTGAAALPGPAISEIAEDLSDPAVSIRTNELKYVYFPKEERGELYDLLADPTERVDVAAQRPDEAEELRRQALAILAEGQQRETQEVPLDQETIDELRALGYVK